MKTVFTYGTFDLFHIGYVNLLKRARELGDSLIVAVSSDEFNQSKGKTTLLLFEHRVAILESCRCVDKVIAEHNWQQKRLDIIDNHVDLFVMGDDWRGKFDGLINICEMVYLPRTKEISSTAMKQAIMVFTRMKEEYC